MIAGTSYSGVSTLPLRIRSLGFGVTDFGFRILCKGLRHNHEVML